MGLLLNRVCTLKSTLSFGLIFPPLGREKGGGRGGHFFNMEDCVIAAMGQEYIVCPQHTNQPVPLQELVPELFMTDFPSR